MVCQSSAAVAFHSLHALFEFCSDLRKVANEIGALPENSIVLFHRVCQALHVRREQLQTPSQAWCLSVSRSRRSSVVISASCYEIALCDKSPEIKKRKAIIIRHNNYLSNPCKYWLESLLVIVCKSPAAAHLSTPGKHLFN
jgi:hypothetical protein